MEQRPLEEAIDLARKTGIVFLGSADVNGIPHVCAATEMSAFSGRLKVTFWHCPTTSVNADTNPHVSVVVWDRSQDKGYQILGLIRSSPEHGHKKQAQGRQTERSILIEAEKVLFFKKTPHTDREALSL